MSKTTSSQRLLFSILALIVSLGANVFLVVDLFRLSGENDQLHAAQSQFDEAQSQLKRDYAELEATVSRLSGLKTQQGELATITQTLRQALEDLQSDYQNSQATADLTESQLENARAQISQLQATIAESNQRIASLEAAKLAAEASAAEAQRTIRNQQRALQRLSQGASVPDFNQQAISAFTATFGSQSDVSVTETALGTVQISYDHDLLFNSTSANLSPRGEQLLTDAARILANHSISELTVVGHADARPIVSDLRFQYPSNWELSTARASAVVRFLIEQGLSEQALVAAGRASQQKVREGNSEADHAENRRLDLLVKLQPSLKALSPAPEMGR